MVPKSTLVRGYEFLMINQMLITITGKKSFIVEYRIRKTDDLVTVETKYH